MADPLEELLRYCEATLAIDSQRLYLTGLSMGGYGSWYFGALWPKRFAAVAPIWVGAWCFMVFQKELKD